MCYLTLHLKLIYFTCTKLQVYHYNCVIYKYISIEMLLKYISVHQKLLSKIFFGKYLVSIKLHNIVFLLITVCSVIFIGYLFTYFDKKVCILIRFVFIFYILFFIIIKKYVYIKYLYINYNIFF